MCSYISHYSFQVLFLQRNSEKGWKFATMSFCSKRSINFMNINKESLVFNGFSNYSCSIHWSVSTAWMVSLLPLGLLQNADKVGECCYCLLHLQLRKCSDTCLMSGLRLCWYPTVQHLSQSPRTILHTCQQFSNAPRRPAKPPVRRLLAYLCCLMGWLPLSGDKASGKD